MSIEHTLERIATALEALAGQPTNTAPVVASPVKRGPGRPPKSATQPIVETAEPAATAPSVPTPASVVEATQPATAPVVTATKEQVSDAMVTLIKLNLRDTVVKILGEHGATSISALAPSEYTAVLAKALAATPAV